MSYLGWLNLYFSENNKNVVLETDDNKYKDRSFEDILWKCFILQDALDFAWYAVETTIQTIRIKNIVETVSGKVDTLVITHDETNLVTERVIKMMYEK